MRGGLTPGILQHACRWLARDPELPIIVTLRGDTRDACVSLVLRMGKKRVVAKLSQHALGMDIDEFMSVHLRPLLLQLPAARTKIEDVLFAKDYS